MIGEITLKSWAKLRLISTLVLQKYKLQKQTQILKKNSLSTFSSLNILKFINFTRSNTNYVDHRLRFEPGYYRKKFFFFFDTNERSLKMSKYSHCIIMN